MQNHLYLFARIRPRREHFEDARRAIEAILTRTRAEPGCHEFRLHVEVDEEESLYLYEVFEDESALAAHYAQPYTAAVFRAYEDWLEAPVEVTRMRALP